MKYVIGVDGGSTKYLIKAKDLKGNTIAEHIAGTTNHYILGEEEAAERVERNISSLLESFGGKREDCCCMVVGASGIDSPKDHKIVEKFYDLLGFRCPVFCMNDGTVALVAATGGVGMLAISGTGSVVVGRNARGKVTRSGGYPISIMGEEGSGRWISVMVLKHMSKWIDESVPETKLVRMVANHFGGLDANRLTKCAVDLYQNEGDTELALLVYEAAKEGDRAALDILKRGARELFIVARTVVKKLGFEKEQSFLSGMWGSVFVKNEFYQQEYRRLFTQCYPNTRMVLPKDDAADGAADMALDYLRGELPFLPELK